MKKFVSLVALTLSLAIPVFAQDAKITTPESISITDLRVEGFETYRESDTSLVAIIKLSVVSVSGKVVETIVVHIRDGASPSEYWLTGRGVAGEPIGYLTEIHSAIQPTGTSSLGITYTGGSVPARINKAMMTWLRSVLKPAVASGNTKSVTITKSIPDFDAITP